MQKISMKSSHSQIRKFDHLMLPKSLGEVLLVVFLILNCTNQKEYCFSRLKEGPDIQGINSNGACSLYLYNDQELIAKREREVISHRENSIANSMLLLCLQNAIEERKCENKSEYIPHFGY
ncbi:hypothetical protein [Leptospira kemamanensis]|nr:hypothetical protein [Leptospira kemamanensis]